MTSAHRILQRAVARHFSDQELREAAAFLSRHEAELPKAENGERVFPDALEKQIARELRRISEGRRPNLSRDEDEGLHLTLSEEDYEALAEAAPETLLGSQEMREVLSRIEAAAIASRHKPRRERSEDRFMATADEYVEPYFAVRNGMPLGEAAKTFNVADIRRHLDAVEQWLLMLEVAMPCFSRDVFLARLERAIEKRRNDAIHVSAVFMPRKLRVRKRKMPERYPKCAVSMPEATLGTTKPTGCSLRTPETKRALAQARSMPLTRRELRNRKNR